jgi:hypothetical protein
MVQFSPLPLTPCAALFLLPGSTETPCLYAGRAGAESGTLREYRIEIESREGAGIVVGLEKLSEADPMGETALGCRDWGQCLAGLLAGRGSVGVTPVTVLSLHTAPYAYSTRGSIFRS